MDIQEKRLVWRNVRIRKRRNEICKPTRNRQDAGKISRKVLISRRDNINKKTLRMMAFMQDSRRYQKEEK